ncbi:MAG TPA: DUF2279 domain-containing protein, partial [Chitinophagaceae bacterium]|nr:DUF2279 domain-containing protein [Chitinophagaceae bacterium]
MKPAPVQNPSSLASLFRARRWTRSRFWSLFSILIIFLFQPFNSFSQTDTLKIDSVSKKISTPSNTHHPSPYYYLTPEQKRKRQWLVGGINVVGYGGSLIIFSNTWYKDYPKTSFHTFDDSKEWLQMDKVGHGWAAYNTGRASTEMWKWAGLSNKKATWIGGLSGTVYLTVIELLDAHSAKWGWSWSDMAANILGSGLYISQQLGWEEQRVQFKFSFHYKSYSDPMLNERSDDLFGSSR